MKIIYHERYWEVYSDDPTARSGRIECIYNEIAGQFEFVRPEPACEEDLRLVHIQDYIGHIEGLKLYDNALLAAGGAIKTAELSVSGQPAFGLIRPPGHHASRARKVGLIDKVFGTGSVSVESAAFLPVDAAVQRYPLLSAFVRPCLEALREPYEVQKLLQEAIENVRATA